MKVILLILSIILLLILYRRENFKSVNSDFLRHTGQSKYDTKELNDLVQKFENQIDEVAQTNQEIPGTQGYTVSIGWDPLFIPEGKTEKEVRNNLSNLDKNSFLKILGWEPFYKPSEADEKLIREHMQNIFANIVTDDKKEVVIQQLVKHEDNFFTFLCYLVESKYDMYYAQVNATVQIQNGTIIIQKLKFEGLVTPLSVEHLKSADNDTTIRKNYDERERREQKFLTEEQIQQTVKEFDDRKSEIMLRMNAHAAGAPKSIIINENHKDSSENIKKDLLL